MTITVPEVALSNNGNKNNVNEELLDGGFIAPKNNAFGHSFRDYEKESLRRAAVEDFYRKNHVNQTLDFVTKGNNTTLPPAALFIIRFHSFYALHRAGDYAYLMNEEDQEMLKWLQVFNKYDLYSKSKVKINLEQVKPHYLSLIDKYFPAKLKW